MDKISLQLMLDFVTKMRDDTWHDAVVMIASKLKYSQNRLVRNAISEWLCHQKKILSKNQKVLISAKLIF